jgi:hypothetical protein
MRNEHAYEIYIKNLPKKDESTMTYIYNVKLDLVDAITKAGDLNESEFD